jgi:hypothetical protein
MSSDIDLPLTRRHDQVSANAAHPSVPGNVYSHVNVAAGGRSHLGNSYNFGPTEDQQILQSILQSLYYPEMGQRGRDVPDAGAGTFKWLFEDGGSQTSHSPDGSEGDVIRGEKELEKEEEEGEGEEGEEEEDDEEKGKEEDDDDEEEEEERDEESDQAEPGQEERGQEESVQEESDQEETNQGGTDQADTNSKESDLAPAYPTYSHDRELRGEMARDLRRWLKGDGDSVFWVTGKPGSGKSTLMKFLRDHDGTDNLLREWAGDKLIVADHFFWLPGTQLQKTFEGLARSLMHAILGFLAADITSARTICVKRRWSLSTAHRPWSLKEFMQMFRNLSNLRGTRIFLLIDGLDECCPQHSHHDLMDILMDIVQQPNLRVLLSSRPWREFAARLDRSPSLLLECATRLDMIVYVTNKMRQATREQSMSEDEEKGLLNLIVDRADGVFLWVELVVRAVVVELKKGRRLSRVHSIVQDLPSELVDYFAMLIYGRIEKTSGNISDTASVLILAVQLEEYRSSGFDYFD